MDDPRQRPTLDARQPSTPAASEAKPERLDEYELLRPLGRGGMGEVWLARDTHLDRTVAIKLITRGTKSSAARARFMVEARAIARLRHTNVVQIFRVGQREGRTFIVMEHLRGRSLAELAGTLDLDRLLHIALGLARGLAAAHREGVLHRDVKPANAILTDEDEVKLLDFGVAKLTGVDNTPCLPESAGSTAAEHLTSFGAAIGTPGYLAPECWSGEPASARSDVYSFGATLFRLLSGHPPVWAESLGELVKLSISADCPPIRSVRADVPAELAAVIDRCLMRDPASRFASAEELCRALEVLVPQRRERPAAPEMPYRGLLPFDSRHERCFFGRESEIAAILERLRIQPVVVIAGRSGSGKSSLARAGILPRLADTIPELEDHALISMTPGRTPHATLTRALAARSAKTVLFIDQLEELVTIADPQERESFAAALEPLLAPAADFRVICTMRSDFIGELDRLPALREPLSRALWLLGPLGKEGLREAIVAPAHSLGFRFESEEDVGALIDAASSSEGSLPLLQFLLAELWERRDRARKIIPRGAIEQIGGLSGALAKHAESVFAALSPAEKTIAKNIFLRSITAEGTRAKSELPAAKQTLEALVRGRLLISGDQTYELIHEALIAGWDRLARWIAEEDETRASLERVERAAIDWDRLGGAREGLWRGRQLAQLRKIDVAALSERERAFVDASRAASRRRAILAAAIPAIALGLFAGDQLRDRALAERLLAEASAADREVEALRARAFEAFDRGEEAEALWKTVLAKTSTAADLYRRAIEAGHPEAIAGRLNMAIRDGEPQAVIDGLRRELRAAGVEVETRGAISVTTDPPGAQIRLQGRSVPALIEGLEEGSYVLELALEGHETVRAPVVVIAGRTARLEVELPRAGEVPPGFIFIPAGEFIYGSREVEIFRTWLDTSPAHAITLPSFLIARHEVTIAEWIRFLDALSPEERARHRPPMLREQDGRWVLEYQGRTLHPGERFVHPLRRVHRSADWMNWPVWGVSWASADAYARSLSGGARLCTEQEWEKAARGVDGRLYPHGNRLQPADANYWDTYPVDDARKIAAADQPAGPDEVGLFPAGRSPYGVLDLAGNVFEWTASAGSAARPDTRVLRGGSWIYDAETAMANNRGIRDYSYIPDDAGLRICMAGPRTTKR